MSLSYRAHPGARSTRRVSLINDSLSGSCRDPTYFAPRAVTPSRLPRSMNVVVRLATYLPLPRCQRSHRLGLHSPPRCRHELDAATCTKIHVAPAACWLCFLSAFAGQGSTHAFIAHAIRWCSDPRPEESGASLLATSPCGVSSYSDHPRGVRLPCQHLLADFFDPETLP